MRTLKTAMRDLNDYSYGKRGPLKTKIGKEIPKHMHFLDFVSLIPAPANKRSLRRHHVSRLKKNRKNYYSHSEMTPKLLSQTVSTATPCSDYMCGNPRKYFGERTIQERRAMQNTQEHEQNYDAEQEENKTSIKLRIFSDIHLDCYPPTKLWYPPVLPDDKETILIIAGDLWTGTKWIHFGTDSWISNVAPRFKQVLVVLGNHDYWPNKHGHCELSIKDGADQCNAMLQDMCLFNVHVLDKSTWEYEDVVFAGATLWTDMDKSSPFAMHDLKLRMSHDSELTYENGVSPKPFSPYKWVEVHKEHRDFFDSVAKKYPEKRIVNISHHVPLTVCGDPHYRNPKTNAFYMSDLSELILDNTNLKMWIFGHSHHQIDKTFGYCRLINHAVGYQSEKMKSNNAQTTEIIEF